MLIKRSISTIQEGSGSDTLSTQSIIESMDQSLNGFSLDELRVYSFLSMFVSLLGFICHSAVLSILVYQQVYRVMSLKKRALGNFKYQSVRPTNSRRERELTSLANGGEFGGLLSGVGVGGGNMMLGATTKSECSLVVDDDIHLPMSMPISYKMPPSALSVDYHSSRLAANRSPAPNLAPLFNHNQQQYNNYVTYAFVFHQTLVDLIRILYCFFYANNIYFEYKRYHIIRDNLDLITGSNLMEQQALVLKSIITSSQQQRSSSDGAAMSTPLVPNLTVLSYNVNSFYERYCMQMASFYSVLTMVTIVNILTILISETCRFYDLKLNSSDTSNYCCVLFGILLIWTSSLIIISSLMLVGVADSAAPTWKCSASDSGAAESTTRSLVINVVWFFLVAFVITISFSYSFSLYKELRKIDYADKRIALYTINASLMAFKAEAIERQIKIVKQTKKRLIILIMLIVIYCVTFVPNFITTILKNTLYATSGSLHPFNLIFSILALSNPTLNSIVLLTLCIKSDDRYLNTTSSSTSSSPSAAAAATQQQVCASSSSSSSSSCDGSSQGGDSLGGRVGSGGAPNDDDDSRRHPSMNNRTNDGRRVVQASLMRFVNRVLSRDEASNAMIVSDRALSEGNHMPHANAFHSGSKSNFNGTRDMNVQLSELEPLKMINVEEEDSCLVVCDDECIKIKNSSSPLGPLMQSSNMGGVSASASKSHLLAHQNSLNQPSMKEFYSKVGNRLGNLN